MAQLKELEARRQAIRMPIRSLAVATGLDEHTVSRVLAGRGGLLATVQKLDCAIAAEEQRLLQHLLVVRGEAR